jgi:hypothetical protein
MALDSGGAGENVTRAYSAGARWILPGLDMLPRIDTRAGFWDYAAL